MTIKVLEKVNGCFPLQLKHGDWIDLFTAEEVKLAAPQANKMHIRKKGKNQSQELRTRDVDFQSCIIKLGVAIQLPKGYEAVVIPRPSTFRRYGILQSNSVGLIDSAYCSSKDEWGMPIVATRTMIIPKGTRVAQFRIQLSQKATVWQKIKWLFSSKPKLVRADFLRRSQEGALEAQANKISSAL